MTISESLIAFAKEKFELLLVAAIFMFVFTAYIGTVDPDRAVALKELWQGLLYAFLALLGVRPRPGSPADRAAVGSASTESGDIIVEPSKPDGKGKTQNEKD